MRSMGRDYELDWRIVEHEAPTHQRIESTSGPFTTTLVYDLASEADGTLVEFSVTGRPTGPLRLLQPLIARTTQRNLDKGFAQLKQVLERAHFEVNGTRPSTSRVYQPGPGGCVCAPGGLRP